MDVLYQHVRCPFGSMALLPGSAQVPMHRMAICVVSAPEATGLKGRFKVFFFFWGGGGCLSEKKLQETQENPQIFLVI